jgi:hypothetical protein
MNLIEAIKQLRIGNEAWITVPFEKLSGARPVRFCLRPIDWQKFDVFDSAGKEVFVVRSGKAPIIGKIYKEGHGQTRTKLYDVFDTKTGQGILSMYVSNIAILGLVEAEFKR